MKKKGNPTSIETAAAGEAEPKVYTPQAKLKNLFQPIPGKSCHEPKTFC